jgi:hypothetical protein
MRARRHLNEMAGEFEAMNDKVHAELAWPARRDLALHAIASAIEVEPDKGAWLN